MYVCICIYIYTFMRTYTLTRVFSYARSPSCRVGCWNGEFWCMKCVYMRVYMHHTWHWCCISWYAREHMYACINQALEIMHVYAYIDKCMHTYMHAYLAVTISLRVYIHTHMHTYMLLLHFILAWTWGPACTYTHIHTYIQTNKHIYIQLWHLLLALMWDPTCPCLGYDSFYRCYGESTSVCICMHVYIAM